MKLYRTIVNVLTGLLIAVVASLLAGFKRIDLSSLDLKIAELETIVLAVVTLVALSNISGLPKKVVDRQWEGSFFGDAFLPFSELSGGSKRRLAGTIELGAIVLTLLSNQLLQAIGYGIITIMYGRGAMINVHVGLPKAALTLAISCISALLMLNELQVVQGTSMPISDVNTATQ